MITNNAATPHVDVVVIGDGPAGSALAAACNVRGVEAVLIGPDEPWTPTYATWLDDLQPVFDEQDVAGLMASSSPTMAVHGDRTHELQRAYGVFDNDALRARLRHEVDHRVGRVDGIEISRDGRPHRIELVDGTEIRARLVVDCSGWPSRFAGSRIVTAPAWQTAFGVVLPEPPAGDLGRATLMDFRPVVAQRPRGAASPTGPEGPATFCYSVPVADGWLVEETVLASRMAIEPVALLPRLAVRLGRHPDALLAEARRTEYVRIPMGAPAARNDTGILTFGAAAGYVHPATGFSVTASLRAAPRVATAIERVLQQDAGRPSADKVLADAVWPSSARRTRVFHGYGLDVLVKLAADDVRSFFDLFFDRPVEEWSRYMRIDTPPAAVASTMARMFRSAPWTLRRQLMAANPAAFASLIRP